MEKRAGGGANWGGSWLVWGRKSWNFRPNSGPISPLVLYKFEPSGEIIAEVVLPSRRSLSRSWRDISTCKKMPPKRCAQTEACPSRFETKKPRNFPLELGAVFSTR